MAGLLPGFGRLRTSSVDTARSSKEGLNDGGWPMPFAAGGGTTSFPLCVPVHRSSHLVEEFVERLADLLEAFCFHHCQIRIGDVPVMRLDLVLHDEVFHRRITN